MSALTRTSSGNFRLDPHHRHRRQPGVDSQTPRCRNARPIAESTATGLMGLSARDWGGSAAVCAALGRHGRTYSPWRSYRGPLHCPTTMPNASIPSVPVILAPKVANRRSLAKTTPRTVRKWSHSIHTVCAGRWNALLARVVPMRRLLILVRRLKRLETLVERHRFAGLGLH